MIYLELTLALSNQRILFALSKWQQSTRLQTQHAWTDPE